MKFLRCSIENYGCLHHTSFDFSDGVNQFLEPNGWGKSTFVSFLCAMLYGLETSSRRNISDNARKHYRPWQEGPFGGSLEFEVGTHQYRVERFFGRREKEDSFLLYDLKTMQLSSDYSSNLGQELFGIDRAGYMKSTCVPQGQLFSGSNESVSASLTRLFQADVDQSQYDKALASLNKAIHFYVKTGKRGEIALIEQELSSTRQQLQESFLSCQKMSHLTEQISSLKLEQQQDQSHLQSIREQISHFTRLEIQSHYNTLQNRLRATEKQLDTIEEFFQDQLPDEDDIRLYLTLCDTLIQMEHQYHQLEAALAPFAGLLPSAASSAPAEDRPDTLSVEAVGDVLLQYHDSLIRQKDSQADFEQASEQLDRIQQQLQQEQQLLKQSVEAERTLTIALEDQEKELSQLPVIQPASADTSFKAKNALITLGCFLLLAILFSVTGICIAVYWAPIPALLFTAAALFISAHILFRNITFADFRYIPDQDANEDTEDIDTVSEEDSNQSVVSSQKAYLQLQKEQLQAELQIQLHQNNIQQIQQKITHETRELELFRQTLSQLNQDIETAEHHLSVFAEKKQSLQQCMKQYIHDIVSYLAQYYNPADFQISDDYETALHELELKTQKYRQLLSQFRDASDEIRIFLQQHPDFCVNAPASDFADISAAPIAGLQQSLSELQHTESLLQNRITGRISQISQIEAEIAQLQFKTEEYHILEEKEQRLRNHLDECRNHHHILSLTESYLKRSHDLFADNYIQSIEKHFLDYYCLFSSSDTEDSPDMHMTSDFKVLRFSQGQLRETDWYSQGVQDLTDLCIRLSIVEDLFPLEPPVLIFDDSFVNLDDATLDRVTQVLHKLAEKWQILYFTCHSSRNLSSTRNI